MIRIDLFGNNLNTWLYNRDNGPNADVRAIATIKNLKPSQEGLDLFSRFYIFNRLR